MRRTLTALVLAAAFTVGGSASANAAPAGVDGRMWAKAGNSWTSNPDGNSWTSTPSTDFFVHQRR